jgi:hypothetical protein
LVTGIQSHKIFLSLISRQRVIKTTESNALEIPISEIRRVGFYFLEKLAANVKVTIELVQQQNHPLGFVPLSQVLRGIVSDMINYHYLKAIQIICGDDGVRIESQVLDLDLLKLLNEFKNLKNHLPQMPTPKFTRRWKKNLKQHFQSFLTAANLKGPKTLELKIMNCS